MRAADAGSSCTTVLLLSTKQHLVQAQSQHCHSPSCSSILSHSSKIKCLMCLRLRLLLRAKARMRPGVPTTICGQFFFSTSSSFLMDRPPKNTATCQRGRVSHNEAVTPGSTGLILAASPTPLLNISELKGTGRAV